MILAYIRTLWSSDLNDSLRAGVKIRRLILVRSPLGLDDGEIPEGS